MTSPPRRPVSWVVLVIVITALAVGGAASILVSAARSPPPSSGPSQLVSPPTWLVTLVLVGFIVFVIASMVVFRLSGNATLSLNRSAVTLLAVVLAALVFLLVLHFLGLAGTAPPGANTTTSHNGTTGTQPPPSGGGHNTTGSGGIISWPGFPPWLPFVVVSSLVLLSVLVAFPALRDFVSDRRLRAESRAAPPEARGVREALREASARFDEGGDPREAILALYATLLARLRPMAMQLDSNTPEEIRATYLERLGVRPDAARTLTRLFEEARYSTHPMGVESGQRARDAVQQALNDLDRRETPA